MGFEACCTPRRDHLDERSNRTMASPPSRNDGPGACASPRRRAPFDHLDSHRNRQERLTRDFYQPAAVTRQLIILVILVLSHACMHHLFAAHISRTTIPTSQIVHHTERRDTYCLRYLLRVRHGSCLQRHYAPIGDPTRLGSLCITAIPSAKSTEPILRVRYCKVCTVLMV